MSTTVLEALMNAEYNLKGHLFMQDIGLCQLHNAIVFLEKGYDACDTMDDLLEEYKDVEDIPEMQD